MNEFFNYYKEAWGRLFVFAGRARRAEYWSFVLINSVLNILLLFFFYIFLTGRQYDHMSNIVSIVLGVLSLGITVRRLHDIGRSGWWLLLCFVPVLGWLVLFIFSLLDSKPGSNRYGANPKE